MKHKINAYFASLMITVIGAGATLLIVHVATSDTLEVTLYGNQAALVGHSAALSH